MPPVFEIESVVSDGVVAELSLDAAAVPEPDGLLLFAAGLGLVEWRRRRARGVAQPAGGRTPLSR